MIAQIIESEFKANIARNAAFEDASQLLWLETTLLSKKTSPQN